MGPAATVLTTATELLPIMAAQRHFHNGFCTCLLLLILVTTANCVRYVNGNIPTSTAEQHSMTPPLGGGNGGNAGPTSMNAGELEALFQVIDSLLEDGTNWRSLHPHPCTQDLKALKGMLCEQGPDKLMHVTRLQFGADSSPPCKATATIPAAVGQLSYLRTLLVSDCIVGAHSSTIPEELGNLANSLQELSLRSNKALDGPIPATLGKLKNLQVLGLAQNSLQGSIPAAIGNLHNLQHLDLSYNFLSGTIPASLGYITGLSIMDLSGNQLSGSIPTSFKGLMGLQKLDLSNNQLKGGVPAELGELLNLQFLALAQNAFTGPLPATFSKLVKLEYFLMDSNPVHGSLPAYVGSAWKQLRELSVSNSYYTGAIPTNLGDLFNVSVINLSNNKLEGSIPPTLEQMNQITYLNLSENFLTGALPFSPKFLQKLGDRLDVHGNPGLCLSPATASAYSASQLLQIRTCDNRAQLSGSTTQGGAATSAHRNSSHRGCHVSPTTWLLLLVIHSVICVLKVLH